MTLSHWSKALGALLAISSPAHAEIVSKWSFENNLLDSASGGGSDDHLRAVALDGPLRTGFVAGVVGQAVEIGEGPGAATVLSAPDSDDLDLAGEFTVEAFVYRTVEHGNDWERFATKWFDGSNNWHWAFRGPPGRSQDLFMNGAQQINQGTVDTDVPLNEWIHVAMTGDPAHGLRLWQNGAVVGSAPYVAPQNGSDAFRLGNAAPGASALQFSGRVDEFQIHNVSRDAAYMASRTALITGEPVITSFTASPAAILAGESSALAWTTSNADSLVLDGGSFINSDVTGQQMAVVANLSESTTFTLTARNERGTTSARVTVGVGASGGNLRLNEFLAINDGGLADEDGDHPDWIEIHNPDAVPASLAGWYLTDDPANLTKWMFPSAPVPALGYLVVFASNKDRVGAELHTNFRLDGDGEYLALVEPDGVTVASEFSPAYPPQQANVSFGYQGDPPVPRALFPPTPAARNTNPAGPIIRGLTENPVPVPRSSEDIEIRAEILPSASPLAAANLHYRIMFSGEVSVPMSDLGNGIYRGIIPASAHRSRQMVRWRVTAEGQDGNASRAPLFADPLNSPEYHGTVIADPRLSSRLPVMERFVRSPAGTETRSGTRGAFFYDGEFYDNIFTRIRGGTSQNWPKKSYKIEFNDGHHFRLRDGLPRVDEINLNTTYTDKSYVRATLAYEHQRDAGLPSPETFPVHFRQNGEFWNVALLVEQPDRDFLRRWDLDPDGALYKGANSPTHYEPFTPLARWEKKTRRHEDKSDLDAFIDGISQTGSALETYLFDNVDLPRQINYMATTCILQNIDGSDKNHYLYRDTEGSGEWTMLPWDLDLTFGPNALNTDTIVAGETGTSHPYIGARPHLLVSPNSGKYNHFLEVIVANRRTRAMLNRRIRTLTDEYLRSGYFQDRIDQLTGQLSADVLLDKARWRGSTHFPGLTYSLRAATDRIKNEYLTPRVPYLTITHGQGGSGLVLKSENAPVKALVPRDGSLGDSWQQVAFDDAGWLAGSGGVGYERATAQTYAPLIGLDLLSPDIPAGMRIDVDGDRTNENNSCFLRYEFSVADRTAISFLKLRVKYDDGFVAYLNGTRVLGINAPVPLAWDSEAVRSHRDTEAVEFEDHDISAFRNALRDGPNVLSVHAMNRDSAGSDMLFACELVDAASGGSGVGIPASQPVDANVEFGAIEFNPPGGNQDHEFIELINPNPFDLDVSGWTLGGGVSHTLRGGTVIPAGGHLYLSPSASAFRSRPRSPKGGEHHFVQGDYEGHLSNFGEDLILRDAGGKIRAQTTTPDDPSDAQLHLVVSEIMYHPAGDPGAEFIELLNISDSVTLDLNGVRFTSGIEFGFAGSAITTLAPGARVLVVRDHDAFRSVHGAGHPVAGEFSGSSVLDNDGERIKLEDATNSTIKDFRYNDALPWPVAPDGEGPSLTLIAPHANPDPALAANWRSSVAPGGSPDQSDATSFDGEAGMDVDSNGLDDLLDYGLGHRAHEQDGLATLARADGVITLSYTENLSADDVEIVPQWSTNLLDWNPAEDLFELATLRPAGSRRTVRWTVDEGLIPSGERLFVRLTARK